MTGNITYFKCDPFNFLFQFLNQKAVSDNSKDLIPRMIYLFYIHREILTGALS